MKNPADYALIWDLAQDAEDRPSDAIALLCDAIAFGCAKHDLNPDGATARIVESFQTLHVAKYLGPKN